MSYFNKIGFIRVTFDKFHLVVNFTPYFTSNHVSFLMFAIQFKSSFAAKHIISTISTFAFFKSFMSHIIVPQLSTISSIIITLSQAEIQLIYSFQVVYTLRKSMLISPVIQMGFRFTRENGFLVIYEINVVKYHHLSSSQIIFSHTERLSLPSNLSKHFVAISISSYLVIG